jgi:hypothetical protein
MDTRRILAGASIVALAVVSLAGPASAKPTETKTQSPGTHLTSARVIGTVKIDRNDPSVAYVLAKYSCTIADPVNAPGHLWVSVKQNDDATVDPDVAGEGSGFGGIATRWEDSHRDAIQCDGKSHTQRFAVDQIEDKSSYQTLIKGKAWVQFCLFDHTTPQGDGQTDFGQPVSSMVWAQVH